MKNWENNIRKVVPYTPGEQPNQLDMIKLNTNENPYPPSPAVTEALKNLSTEELRLYPDPAAENLLRHEHRQFSAVPDRRNELLSSPSESSRN